MPRGRSWAGAASGEAKGAVNLRSSRMRSGPTKDLVDETEDKQQAAAKRRGRAWLGAARARAAAVSRRGREWVDRQDPRSPTGGGVGALRRHPAVDRPPPSAFTSLH